MANETLKKKETFTIKDASNAREVALIVILRISEEGRKSHIALREALGASRLSDRDRAFAKRCVDGCLDYLLHEDALINRYSKLKVIKLDPYIRGILRMSVYQLKFMDKVPDSAVCNEAVKLTRLHGLGRLTGYVNGILRNMVRDKESGAKRFFEFELPWERYSLPEWLYKRLKRELGPKKALLTAENYLLERAVQVRFNLSLSSEEEITSCLERDGIGFKKIDIKKMLEDSYASGLLLYQVPEIRKLPVMYELSGLKGIERSEAFRKGYIQVQDVSSALAAASLEPEPGDRVLDICSAPGGKTIELADLMNAMNGDGDSRGEVIARDLTADKLRLIRENVTRCGFKNVKVQQWDALVPDEKYKGKADRVLADLPCSGLGIAGKKPDIKWNITEKSIEELSWLQARMLDVSGSYLKPGGRLVYSTCTITEEEDEKNASEFAKRSGLKLLYMTKLLPSDKHDGFFISVFERQKDGN